MRYTLFTLILINENSMLLQLGNVREQTNCIPDQELTRRRSSQSGCVSISRSRKRTILAADHIPFATSSV